MALTDRQQWQDVLAFWFPEGRDLNVAPDTHHAHWHWRMQGGADDRIVARFAGLTTGAARGELNHWAQDPHGRLALIILLDQFSRSVWRDDPRGFAQDPDALALTLAGLDNGHFAALETPWFQIVFGLPLGHCEGPDHLDRIDRLIRLRDAIAATAPPVLQPIYAGLARQARDVRKVIAAFGRHPHRNGILERESTPAEAAYIADGRFPHRMAFR